MPITAPPLSRRRAFVALPLAWAAFVLVMTLTPADEMPETPTWNLMAFDTAAHASVFFVLAVLAYFSGARQTIWPRLHRYTFRWLLVACVAFGAAIEIVQMAMDLGRHGEWSDVLSDAIGVVIGLGLMASTRRFWQ